jgi:hypothetical protein
MQKLPLICAVAGMLISVPSCATRAVVIDTASDVVRLDKPARASVSTMRDGKWTHAGKITLPAGWLAGPGPLPE